MIVAAFDLATATGCCDGFVGKGPPRLWTWHLDDAGEGRPARLFHLAKFLRLYFKQEPCDAVVYEAPIPIGMLNSHPAKNNINAIDGSVLEGGKGFMLSEANVAFARGAIGVLEMTCTEFGKPVEAVRVQAARKSVLGWATNSEKKTGINTKKRVIQDVERLGVDAENDNECDAYVAWYYACSQLNPRLAVATTPLFRGMT
jgi:hypothetical protein